MKVLSGDTPSIFETSESHKVECGQFESLLDNILLEKLLQELGGSGIYLSRFSRSGNFLQPVLIKGFRFTNLLQHIYPKVRQGSFRKDVYFISRDEIGTFAKFIPSDHGIWVFPLFEKKQVLPIGVMILSENRVARNTSLLSGLSRDLLVRLSVTEKVRLRAQYESSLQAVKGIAHHINNATHALSAELELQRLEAKVEASNLSVSTIVTDNIFSPLDKLRDNLLVPVGDLVPSRGSVFASNGLFRLFENECRHLRLDFLVTSDANCPGNVPYSPGLKRAIRNLVINSFEANATGLRYSIEPVIFSLSSGNKVYARIVLSDNGVGISKKSLPHIFEPFYSSKGFDGVGAKNLGLGLNQTMEAIYSLGGEIFVESDGRKGTEVTLLLPIV